MDKTNYNIMKMIQEDDSTKPNHTYVSVDMNEAGTDKKTKVYNRFDLTAFST